MNNAFYSKTMENVKDRVDIKFCITPEQFKKNVESPLFANQVSIIKKGGLTLVRMTKRTVELNKPLYLGACVLDFSKLLMYEFHYDTMKVKYPNALMMKTDTDSLLYYIHTEDLYQDFKDADIPYKNQLVLPKILYNETTTTLSFRKPNVQYESEAIVKPNKNITTIWAVGMNDETTLLGYHTQRGYYTFIMDVCSTS